MTLSGTVTTLHSFCYQGYIQCTGGQMPEAGIVQGTDGNFYGITRSGGTDESGTIFEMTPAGAFTTLHNFCGPVACISGNFPQAALVQGADGSFYGTTSEGGSGRAGTIFSLSVAPALSALPTPQARAR